MAARRRYSEEPEDRQAFADAFDRFYSRFGGAYAVGVRVAGFWRRWLSEALPHLRGPRVLEASFGTGWLLGQYADRFETHGIDLNPRMVEIARAELRRRGLSAELRQGDVAALPYPDRSFETVLSTMAFSGYPDGRAALSEFFRVLVPGGRLVMVDVAYPADGNRVGGALIACWRATGDLIRDVPSLLRQSGFSVREREIGGWGSVHLYVASKPSDGRLSRRG